MLYLYFQSIKQIWFHMVQIVILFILLLAMQAPQQIDRKRPVAEIFAEMMNQNPNQPETKAIVQGFTSKIQGNIYHAMTGTQQSYLQAYGLSQHEEQHFNYLNMLLHERTTEFLEKVAQSKIEVKSTIPPPPPPPPKINQQIVQQVDEIINNVDLPMSLFKRKDHYWSPNNAKTLQVKDYIKKLHEEDRKWKGELKKKRQNILNQKNQIYHKNNEEVRKQELKAKEDEKNRMAKKIQLLKNQPENRKKTIQQSLQFIKKQGRPLFKKMQEQYLNKVELPSLQQKKRKLSEIRSLRKSVDLIQIQQHRQKVQKVKEEHDPVKIYSQAVKVSYKSNYHKSLQKSRMDELEGESRIKTMVDKKDQYAKMVKQRYRPQVDAGKAAEIAERVELMNRRFTRAKRKQRKYGNDQEEDDQDAEQEQEPEPEPQPEQEEQQEQQDQDAIKLPKDDQYEPNNQERYRMGLKFLEEAKRKRRKKLVEQRKAAATPLEVPGPKQSASQDARNKTFSVKDAKASNKAKQLEQKSQRSNQFETIDPIYALQNQSAKKIKYRNYLHQMSRVNRTIDQIDTTRVKKQFTNDMKLKQPAKLQQVENKIRSIEEKAKHEEQLLKHGRRRKSQALDKKQQLDGVILDTIKARLALMKS